MSQLYKSALFLLVFAVSVTLCFAAPIPVGAGGMLHTKGKDIVDRNDKVVLLKGVNIGGWLVTEGWMCGQSDDGGRTALEQLEKRFTSKQVTTLMNAWYDHWITTNDLDLIKSWGFNVIRVPFGYRNLQDAAGNWIKDAKGNIVFTRMDWILKEAAKRGLYVIFDLHIWPRQFEKDGYGLPSRWSEDGKAVRAKMKDLWTEVAKHYKGDGRIAAFDVINEPEGSPWNAPHHAFTDAIREQDPHRMVILEWCGYENMPKEFTQNAVYSDHYSFKDDASLEKFKKTLSDHPEVTCPIFLGEMKAGEDNEKSARWMADTMNKEGWSWCIWTYKCVNYGGWGAINYTNDVKYDLAKDSYESILDKWSHVLTQWQDPAKPKNYYTSQWWIDGFGQKKELGVRIEELGDRS